MTYTEALERAKSTPVMRPHWKYFWLIFENGRYLELNYFGLTSLWYPMPIERYVTDWIEAPKPISEF